VLRRDVLLGVSALVSVGRRLAGASMNYNAEIAEWRKNYDRDLRSEKGPLWLIARNNVPEGKTGIGSDPSNRVALPDRAPKFVGTIERQGSKVNFVPAAGIAVTLNGKPMSGPLVVQAGATSKPGDKLAFGDFEIAISEAGGQYQLTVRDQQSPYVKQFHGAVWYAVDPRYRVPGAFTPYPEPKELRVADTSGRTRTRIARGYVTFRLNGESLHLEPVAVDGIFFFMFKDVTTGHGTYPVGRFLDADVPKDGKVIMDFNKAYNPYCAFNPYSSCPIPPKYNTLTTRVEAGEKYSGAH
jgi:uncharacterized protein (DUF1684 family)